MDYDLARLGEKQFEHLSQALLVHFLGPDINIYGAGPDGGREASWEGLRKPENEEPNLLPGRWDGFNVAQAKYCNNPGAPIENAKWLTRQITEEFDEWTRPNTRRARRPEAYLVVTNVRLSAVPCAGSDRTRDELLEYAHTNGLMLEELVIWHYDHIRVLLDNALSIRSGYAAWITPGDVLSRLLDSSSSLSDDFRTALETHAAKLMREDLGLNLTQAGSVSDNAVGITDVYIDLPAYPPEDYETEIKRPAVDPSAKAYCDITAEMIAIANYKLDAAAVKSDARLNRACRTVVIGGPGQGKSTFTQYLTQIYRAAFLHGTSVLDTPEIKQACDAIATHATSIGLALPIARRWPIRIALTELADRLSKGVVKSVFQYVTVELAKRSSTEVTIGSVRAWLKEYPWLVIFDGLDEVPESSNRADVLTAISDFYIDARSLGADVVIITTTRPQGYNDGFDKSECRHYELAPLPVDIALSYAGTLISKRLGEQTTRAARVRSTLSRAAEDESTSKLMSTPLQTTILTILVERLGHAPKDRWRLFSSYYRVIYQREQEKGGELAELLQDYESDINAIHFEIGFILQRRGESSGDSTSSISKSEFTEFIAARMIKNGNAREDSYNLANRIIQLATDRLVFLAVLRSDAIGFEIRSLQEYMAAEKIVAAPEATIAANVRAISEPAYWHNVLLFVAGSIFATRDHLCAELVTLCADLNTATSAHRATLFGSHLAYALLAERIATTKPIYSRILATTVTELLRLPMGNDAYREVVGLFALGHRSELENALIQAASGSYTQKVSAAVVLGSIEQRGEKWASALLDSIAGSATAMLRDEIISIAITFDVASIFDHFPGYLENITLEAAADLAYSFTASRGHPNTKVLSILPDHISALVAPSPFQEGIEVSRSPLSDLPQLEINILAREVFFDRLARLASYAGEDKSWKTVSAIAQCAQDYNMQSLAQALSLAQTLTPRPLHILGKVMPWPFSACLDTLSTYPTWLNKGGHLADCENFRQEMERYRSERAEEVIEAAVYGVFGDRQEWDETASSRPSVIDLSDLLSWDPEVGKYTEVPLPAIASNCSIAAVFSMAGSLSFTHDNAMLKNTVRWLPQACEFVTRLPTSFLRDGVLSIVRFATSVCITEVLYRSDRIISSEETTPAVSKTTLQAISRILGASSYESTAWLNLVGAGDDDIYRDLASAISRAEFVDAEFPVNFSVLLAKYTDSEMPWRVARLALLGHTIEGPSFWPKRIGFSDDGDRCDDIGLRRCDGIFRAIEIASGQSEMSFDSWVQQYLSYFVDSDDISWDMWGSQRSAGYDVNLNLLFSWLAGNGYKMPELSFGAELALRLTNTNPSRVVRFISTIAQDISAQKAGSLSFEVTGPSSATSR
ncbi:NACHT domain-containing protein [Nocardia sp. CA-119907]|uniref:NACHT domain-containing protein n=1 Tax=Nocardia sp. CA-119907 TaxID=3239973 RepID=UPI003D98F1B7